MLSLRKNSATQWCEREVPLCAFKYEDSVVLAKSSKGKKINSELWRTNQTFQETLLHFLHLPRQCVCSSIVEHEWWFYMLLRNKKTFLWCIQTVFVLLLIKIVIQCYWHPQYLPVHLSSQLDLSILFLTNPSIKPLLAPQAREGDSLQSVEAFQSGLSHLKKLYYYLPRPRDKLSIWSVVPGQRLSSRPMDSRGGATGRNAQQAIPSPWNVHFTICYQSKDKTPCFPQKRHGWTYILWFVLFSLYC